jgi:hypothetical protein
MGAGDWGARFSVLAAGCRRTIVEEQRGWPCAGVGDEQRYDWLSPDIGAAATTDAQCATGQPAGADLTAKRSRHTKIVESQNINKWCRHRCHVAPKNVARHMHDRLSQMM